MKNLLTLILLLTAATGWSQDSLKNASLIGQSTRNQKVGQGFQVGFVGSSDDTLQVHTKFQLVSGSPAAGRVLTSSATGIATWQTPSANLKRGNGVYISNDSIGVGRVAFIENLVWQYADKFFAISDSADINVATNFFTVGDVGAGNSRLLIQLHRLQFTGTNRITLTSGDDLTASVADDMTITVGGDITERAYITIGSAVLDTINGLINGDYYEKHRANLFTQRIYKTGVSTFAIGPDLARFDADSSRKLHAVSFGGNGDTVGTKIAGVASDAHIYKSTVIFSNKHNVLADYYTPTSGQMLISDSTGWGFWSTQTRKAYIDTNGAVHANGLQVTDGSEGVGKVLTSDASGNASWSAATYGEMGYGDSSVTTALTQSTPAKATNPTNNLWNTGAVTLSGITYSGDSIIIQNAGIYGISGYLCLSGSTGSELTVKLYLNGSLMCVCNPYNTLTNNRKISMPFEDVVALSSGDVIEVYVENVANNDDVSLVSGKLAISKIN